ncbi:TPA_asm: polyprotein [Zea virus 1]|uniref:Replicase n=1 Tax=Zea virus 1 TaxID=2977999 RepID=A0A9N7AAN6_9RHAB|nr:TPA_asm: polyprotein [Zea virus 1]
MASAYDILNDDFSDDEDLAYFKDEEPLSDMHLSSAINLDYYREIISPGSVLYNIKVPESVRRDVDCAVSYVRSLPGSYYIQIGVVHLSTRICAPGGPLTALPLEVYKEMSEIVYKGLRSREIHIPIAESDITKMLPDVMVYEHWGITFSHLLQILCSRAEYSRGGRRSIYADVKIESNGVRGDFKLYNSSFETRLYRNCSIIIDKADKTAYLGNTETILLLMDTLGQRICLQICNQIARLYNATGYVPQNQIDEILSVGDRILSKMGNDGYDIIAMYESLTVGMILTHKHDPVTDNSEFLNNCTDEISSMLEDCEESEDIKILLNEMAETLSQLEVDQLSNVFCLYRCWGHPIVDIYEGMAKVHRIGKEQKDIKNLPGSAILNQFRKSVMINYFRQNHFYPPCTVDPVIERTYIAERIKKNLPLDEYHPGYATCDFAYIQLGQIWEVPLTYDLCHLINDKAVSPNQDELAKCITRNQSTVIGADRRGIVRWLKGASINCRDFLKAIEDNGLPENECTIGMYEKEREIKIVARMFSLMSENMRNYFVLTEELIANRILPLFPEITMKDPLNVLQKKLWTMGGVNDIGTYNTNINIDFSKWNLNMREDLTRGLFLEIDRMFGYTNVISRTYEIFEKSFIYSCSGKYIPKVQNGQLIDDPPMAYRGHKGGFEGLRQKGWTIATVCLLLEVAEREGVKMKLMGQGDNQIVRVIMPSRKWRNHEYTEESKQHDANQITMRFISSMDKWFKLAKLPIKVRETWVSSMLFAYGKAMLYEGKLLPQWYKKVLRSYALSNEGQVTLSGVIGTIATNMSAAAGASEHPDVMYIVFLIMAEWSMMYLIRYHPFTRKSILQVHSEYVSIPGAKGKQDEYKVWSVNPKELIATMLMIPTAIGGSVTIPLTGFLIRGFPDHASEGYAWVKMLASVDGPYRQMFENWYSFLQNFTIEWDMLLQSPWSINHRKPPTPGLQNRELVREWLTSGKFDNNQFIKESRVILAAFNRKTIAGALITDPVNPLVTSEIYGLHAHMYVDGILRRVENTRTIKKMTLSQQTKTRLISKMMEAEHNYILYLQWRCRKRGDVFSTCATEQARMARNIGWGKTITGVTTPHPLELFLGTVCKGSNHKCPITDYLYERVDKKGGFTPYLGSKIKSKVISNQDIDARREPLINIGARICRYANWIGIGPNLMEVVRKGIECVCDISIYNNFIDEDPKENKSTGSIDHRFNPAGASEGVFINYAPQVGSTIYLSSDCMPRYGRGQTNYTLHFQALYCFAQYADARMRDCTYIHRHLECQSCIVPTVDEIKDLAHPFPHFSKIYSVNVLSAIHRALGYINIRGNLDVTEKTTVFAYRGQLSDYSVKQIRMGVTWALAIKISFNLIYGSIGGNIDARIDDLQEYPRIYSYKIFRDNLLERVALCIIALIAIEGDLALESVHMSKLRRRAAERLTRLPLNHFKGFAGLIVGRVDYNQHNEYMFISGSYPETVSNMLSVSKHAIIEYISRIGKIKQDPIGKTPIPLDFLSNKQYRFLIMLRTILVDNCNVYRKEYLEWSEDDPTHPFCSDNHINTALYKTMILDVGIDKMFKMIPTLNCERSAPEPLWEKLEILRLPLSSHIKPSKTVFVGSRKLADQPPPLIIRAITLPTRSIYKWSVILSNLQTRENVVVLGDGTGGTSLTVRVATQAKKIFPCALLESKSIIPQDMMSVMPQLTRNYSRIHNDFLLKTPDNIMSDSWVSEFSRELNVLGVKNTTLVCDIENMEAPDLFKAISQLPEGLEVIIKVYGGDIMKNPRAFDGIRDAELCYTSHANTKRHELFIHGVIDPIYIIDAESLVHECYEAYGTEREIDLDTGFQEVHDIQMTYKNLCRISRTLAMNHIMNLGITLRHEVLRLPGKQVWAYALQFLNRHYKSKRHCSFIRSGNVLTPDLCKKVGRAMLIILGLVVTPFYILRDKQWGLTIDDGEQPHGLRILFEKNAGRNAVTLTKKDMQALEALYSYRAGQWGVQDVEEPEGENEIWLTNAYKKYSFSTTLSVNSASDYIDIEETNE